MDLKKNKNLKAALSQRKKKTKNVFFGIFFFFFIGGYTFFFTSYIWMPDTGAAKRITELHQTLDWNDRAVSILRWEYSPEQQLMEVELQITNKKFDGTNTYKFSAMESRGTLLKVDTVIEEPDWIILQIHDIPKKFLEISLRMEMQDDEDAGLIKMYTNTVDVTRVAGIDKKDRLGYMRQRLYQEMAGYEKDIDELNKNIAEEQEKINAIRQEIARLEDKRNYQTEKEIEITNGLIADAKSDLESAKDRVSGYNAGIAEYEERIQNIEEKAEQLQGEKK